MTLSEEGRGRSKIGERSQAAMQAQWPQITPQTVLELSWPIRHVQHPAETARPLYACFLSHWMWAARGRPWPWASNSAAETSLDGIDS